MTEEQARKYPFWAWLRGLFQKVSADDCQGLAAEVAFNMIQSLIPATFFLISLFGLLGQTSVFYALSVDFIDELAPAHTGSLLLHLLDATIRGSTTGLTLAGMMITLWSASGSGGVIVKGLRRAYGIPEKGFPFWYTPMVSIVLVLLLGLMLVVAIYLIMFGDALISWLHGRFHLPFSAVTLLRISRWLVLGCGITAITTLTYALILRPKTGGFRWRVSLPGAVFFLIAWVSVSELFSLYINHLHQFNPVYGALGALIILVTWLYYSALIFFVGAEITARRAGSADKIGF
ncbi:YihY/virulence factor BrkB family protein [Vampirovibrio chlorellavorus]|uniref:YihY/virulence factor BrkB family protein n=1 Tax=Vampirovibrio chlorellavorus TaxID=758823 RepID=UPI0026F12303|nr:YihY/virulence factor BrkB family protein [Vampirovibrio chlorellavorus]